jgi:small conductance mechanosensitive channel
MDYQKYLDLSISYIETYSVKIIAALAILIIGLWVVKKIISATKKLMTKRGIDETLQKFLGDLLGWALKILVFTSAISQIGIETTSFIALIGAAGLAVGLALQGSLSNFAGGALIMIFKPFKVGDLIEAQGHKGSVKEIQIFVTKLNGAQNKLIIIPNGILSNGSIINYTEQGKLRVDLVFGVGYDEDIKKTKEVLMQVMLNNPLVLKDPEPSVNVLELADSSVNFAVRPWTTPDNYWKVHFQIIEEGKIALDNAGINIPYPHRVLINK